MYRAFRADPDAAKPIELLEPLTGIEPVTSSLPRKCSTPELQRPENASLPVECSRAGDETRTRDIQLGRLMLYQLSYSRLCRSVGGAVPAAPKGCCLAPNEWWGEQDSNLRSRKTADLQSAPVGHLGISPFDRPTGANEGTRTPDRLITNQLLYQLSYIGLYNTERTVSVPPSTTIWVGKGLQM